MASASPKNRILIVEDEVLLAMLLEDLLDELGHEVAGAAQDVEHALSALDRERPDLALVDVNLAGSSSLPVLEELRRLDIPFALVTGYGDGGPFDINFEAPVLPKPYRPHELAAVVDALAALSAGRRGRAAAR